VFESEHKLRHLPFFEEAASHDEGDAAWRSATAGLVVLRLVDAWLEEGRAVVADDGWSVRSVRAAIESTDEGDVVRSILDRVVDALHDPKPDIHVVVTPLMAYAKALEYDAKWLLAEDVYKTVLAHLHPVEDSDASIAAHLRLGQCYRNLNRVDEAAAAFGAASEIANAVGDIVGVLRARLGDARISMLKGNLPRAEEILDDTIRLSVGDVMKDVRSQALHDRSNVAHFRGQYELAIQFAYKALGESHDGTARDRILGDIAVSVLELGVYSAARDAYLVLSATAQEQFTRWAATLNLMEIAAQTHTQTLFELYRRQLVNADLPPRMSTAFQLTAGEGYQRFGSADKARKHIERALAMAEEHDLSQYVFEAEDALRELNKPTPPPKESAVVPLDLEEVADAIRELRETAGV
jgi:tetratricopeptide (TPR) repeat protein